MELVLAGVSFFLLFKVYICETLLSETWTTVVFSLSILLDLNTTESVSHLSLFLNPIYKKQNKKVQPWINPSTGDLIFTGHSPPDQVLVCRPCVDQVLVCWLLVFGPLLGSGLRTPAGFWSVDPCCVLLCRHASTRTGLRQPGDGGGRGEVYI